MGSEPLRDAVQDHSSVIEDAVDEVAVCGEAGVVDVVDVVADDCVFSGVSALAVTARFDVPSVGEELVPDAALGGVPHSDIGVGWGFKHVCSFLWSG